MSEPYEVLVVCEGNLCRSPVAERLLRRRLPDATDVQVASAGTRARIGAPMDEYAAAELTRLGGDPKAFAPRRLTAELVTSADLVLTATRAQRGRVIALVPTALKRTFTLLELAALLEDRPWGDDAGDRGAVVARAADWRSAVSGRGDDLDLADPIGRSPKVHRATADLIDGATRVIAAWLT